MPVVYKKGTLIDDYQRRVVNTWIQPLVERDVLTVTRGHSLAIDQLHTIVGLAYDNGITFSELNPADVYERVNIDYAGKTLEAYSWWRTWTECLRRGLVINPPLAAVVPFAFGTHKEGDLIQASPHIVLPTEDPRVRPCPLDFSQRVNRGMTNEYVDIHFVEDVIHQAQLNGAPINQIKAEPKNGCVHVGLSKEV